MRSLAEHEGCQKNCEIVNHRKPYIFSAKNNVYILLELFAEELWKKEKILRKNALLAFNIWKAVNINITQKPIEKKPEINAFEATRLEVIFKKYVVMNEGV